MSNNNNKESLTVEDQVSLYNGLQRAAKYTNNLKDTSKVKQVVEKALNVCYKKGFPHSDGPEQVELEKTLVNLCKEFIKEHQINCAETVYQSDRVIENAYELIEKICDVVGYYKYPEDE